MLCRPWVGVHQVHDLQDVKRFYMVMRPTSREGAKCRLIVFYYKRLPAVEMCKRSFGVVDAVAPKVSSRV